MGSPLQVITAVSQRLRAVSRDADLSLVTFAVGRVPEGEQARRVLGLVQLAQYGVLISNQLCLITDQIEQIPMTATEQAGSDEAMAKMARLAGRQLTASATAFSTRDERGARRIDVQDDDIDHLNREVFHRMATGDVDQDGREVLMRHVLIAASSGLGITLSTSPNKPFFSSAASSTN